MEVSHRLIVDVLQLERVGRQVEQLVHVDVTEAFLRSDLFGRADVLIFAVFVVPGADGCVR